MNFKDRLKSLSFETYAEYLESAGWKRFRASYKSSDRPKKCLVCGSKRITLHHNTYIRLGSELLTDVDPLCWDHHKRLHEILSEKHWMVDKTASVVAILRGNSPVVVVGKKKKKTKADKSGIVSTCEGKMVKLTHQIIDMGRSQRGGWNKKQLECLGIKWGSPPKRWKRRLVGVEVAEVLLEKFLSLRTIA